MTAERPTSSLTGRQLVREQHAARCGDRDQNEESDANDLVY
jgi:hypothetical protein